MTKRKLGDRLIDKIDALGLYCRNLGEEVKNMRADLMKLTQQLHQVDRLLGGQIAVDYIERQLTETRRQADQAIESLRNAKGIE